MQAAHPAFYTLWAINAPLDRSEMRRQLDDFASSGVDGVVFHPRFYPGAPPYLDDEFLTDVSDAILYARDAGLEFWIYDEDGWPSGTVGGRMLADRPDLRQRWIDLVKEEPTDYLSCFDRDGQTWYLKERFGEGVDYLNPALADEFIGMTYARYRDGLSREAFSHVRGFFDDEPEFGLGHAHAQLSEFGAVPWSPGIETAYKETFGESLIAELPSVFFDDARSGIVRDRFWSLLSETLSENFLGQLNSWCIDHGKIFTAHTKGEEHPLFQIPTVGSLTRIARSIGLPGLDALERFPSNNFYPRQVSTVARQFGSGRCMVEAFGGAGWGATPADLERYLLWLGRNGCTDFVLHLSQYRLSSSAIEDWPPSHPRHITWSAVYPDLLERVRVELGRSMRRSATTLLISPHRGISEVFSPWEFTQTNIHSARSYPDTPAGRINDAFMATVRELDAASVEYDVTDERTVELDGTFGGGRLRIGTAVYESVVVANGARLSVDLAEKLSSMQLPATVLERRNAPTVPSAVAPILTIPLSWELLGGWCNSLLLPVALDQSGRWSATVTLSKRLPPVELSLRFADIVTSVTANGRMVTTTSGPEGSRGVIDVDSTTSLLRIEFNSSGQEARPYVWVEGLFFAKSKSTFELRDDMLRTAGAFYLDAPTRHVSRDLVAGGFPFARLPIVVSTAFVLDAALESFSFLEPVADAVRIEVDGRDSGWLWGDRLGLPLAERLETGTHEVRVTLIPNGFNHFGPHHHYVGDPSAVSPEQMRGIRNFADLDGAPQHTHDDLWRFRRYQLPSRLVGHQAPSGPVQASGVDKARDRSYRALSPVNRFTTIEGFGQ